MARPKDPLARSALLAAARREFVRCGILRARIEDITQASGLSKGAYYLHFESKEALFRVLVKELEGHFEEVRSAREKAYRELLGRGLPGRRDPSPFIAELLEVDGRNDRWLLQLLWEWRDVTDVLLRGSQGTEFETVMWKLLDREMARVEGECVELKAAGLMRGDVPPSVLGSMIVGTYLMVARRMCTLSEKPDFEPLVHALQSVISDGVASPSVRAHRNPLPLSPLRVRRRPPAAAAASRRRP